ncbi:MULTISPECIES: AmmeMemoRadiSam system radical SAM enzyme [Desulfococcus]|uniref:Radical SAM domain protein n=1 Tax=Desulfococcus multivorans DSM 2059 TaxID=1121405 RepID=S7U6G9_DESML|nr:AmmeMemoRadiSam system radical SAM enzyme [Desulfococcus multivorans]AOY59128.1 radical SAM domain protein [Desulfococcus multivorans]AQV01363.1 AmmeMemoRadiSam system radical SAM enzyme [Desulfococcus multivorans]EPR44937.1 Radical SAM domain protein [Desulfococcus multivorans DSM 2059]SJZ83789.1 pyruvate formate lyase activating enzyme [Desulfococcus multivorans DSM 2059]
MHIARFFHKLEDDKVQCHLCAHECIIDPGKRGICAVRENRAGTLYSLVYGRLISGNADPIEKKPLFHFLPGTRSYSIATVGCNFRCLHCQNYTISQWPRFHDGDIPGENQTPAQVVDQALATRSASIAYTYTEPTIFSEFAYDTALLAREKGLRNIFVSNGYMTEASATAMAAVIDGDNIDLKSFSDGFYRKVCKAKLQPVLDTIVRMKTLGVWVEVTTLLIPGLNDSDAELHDIARFLHSTGADIPWHVTAFYPTYKMLDRPATPVETLRRARDIGFAAGLRYVYTGNLPGDSGENTFCPVCNQLLIERRGFIVRRNRMVAGACPDCGAMVDGFWQ